MVAIGKFSRANHLLEFALTKQREMTALLNDSSCTRSYTNQRTDYILGGDDDDEMMTDTFYEFGCHDESDYDTSESSFDYGYDNDDDDDDDEMYIGNLIHCDQTNQRKNTFVTTPYSISENGPSTPSPCTKDRFLQVTPEPAGFSRLSSCPQVQTFPYSGQQVDRSPHEWIHHKIYSMPIVMDECEWKEAPMDDRTFVLIFNSALSNHLLGVHRLMRFHQLQCRQKLNHHHRRMDDFTQMTDYRKPFEVAKMLYKLALEVFSGAPSTFVGVDRLCYPAVFNNLSHVCKVLDGYDSQNVYNYDKYLLKSIYWLIDSRQPIAPNQQGMEMPSLSISGSATSPSSPLSSSRSAQVNYYTANSTDRHSGNNSYDDADAEILDAFVENVFYLIGTSQSIAPAAAA